MYLPIKTIKEILNLGVSEQVSTEVADRQTAVIYKAFNHLIQDNNDFLYIGDEVGLGKTYIALGIAALLRHFSAQPHRYQDMIIVPKKNLQKKWEKEIKNFIEQNYLINHNRVKSVLGEAIGSIHVEEKIELLNNQQATYRLFRMSSFSLSFGDNWKEWKGEFKKKIKPYPQALELFNKANQINFFDNQANHKDKKLKIKRFLAYLLNICLPQIECLIVDEAHNFKHGLSLGSSARNQVVARILGIKDEEKDQEIFEKFPKLKNLVQRKVNKLLLLSATPMDKNLLEIAAQVDCFLPKHLLQNKTETEINALIPKFMIRGLMNFELNGQVFSRNQYRHEHRNGNVDMVENGQPQTLDNPLHGLIMGIVQHQTIRELNRKNNSSFEIGMLAGFESFIESNPKKISLHKKEEEYEDTSGEEKYSEDRHIIKQIASTYQKTFGRSLPHPKQDKLVDELFENYLKNQKKALVFVRRIATTTELEQRLLNKLEHYIITKLKHKNFKYQSEALDELLKEYQLKHYEKSKFTVFKNLSIPINRYIKNQRIELISDELDHWLDFLYLNKNATPSHQIFVKKVRECIDRQALKRFKPDFVKQTTELLIETQADWKEELKARKSEGFTSDKFFFNAYLSSSTVEGKRFRDNLSKQNYFSFNYILFNEKFKIFQIDQSELKELLTEIKKDQLTFIASQNRFKELFSINGRTKAKPFKWKTSRPKLRNKTFITVLLLEICHSKFKKWIDREWIRAKNTKGRMGQKALFIERLEALLVIISNVFRNGSGLLPTFITAKSNQKSTQQFNRILKDLIKNNTLFKPIKTEIETILDDFSLIMSVNFSKVKDISGQLRGQSPVIGKNGHNHSDLSKVALQFRMPGFPYILIATDILKEGEDLHTYCQAIFHYGIAWNPTDMEQRTGRIDRIGSLNARRMKRENQRTFDNKVQVFFPYLSDSLEVNQVAKVFKEMNRFITTFYKGFLISLSKKSDASTEDVVLNILPQETNKLKSKFEHHYFEFNPKKDQILEIQPILGVTSSDFIEKLEQLKISMESQFYFHTPIVLNRSIIQITGNIKLKNDRKVPFKVNFIYKVGRFHWNISSFVCRENAKNIKRIKTEISNYYIINRDLVAYETDNFELSIHSLTQKISDFVIKIDTIKALETAKDEKISF